MRTNMSSLARLLLVLVALSASSAPAEVSLLNADEIAASHACPPAVRSHRRCSTPRS